MANIYSYFQDQMKARNASGITQREMAYEANTSQQHINRLLNGEADQLSKVKVETFLRLFPEARRLLEQLASEGNNASNISSPHAVAACGDVSIQQLDIGVREKLDALASFVLKSSLSSEEKVTAMKLLH